MEKKEKKLYKKWWFWTVIIIIIITMMLISPLGKLILNPTMDKYYNSNIDYSCNLDSDCEVKKIGGNCAGTQYSCVNKDSISGVYFGSVSGCEMFNLKPISCQCVNNKCENKYKK